VSESDRHIIHNGEIYTASDPILFHNNRAFCYGDALFETMHAYSTEIQFVDLHFHRLYKGMQALQMNISDKLDQKKVTREISRLLNRDKQFGGSRIRLTVYRDSTGFYTPKGNDAAYLIESIPLEFDKYQLNNIGLTISIYSEIVKQVNLFSNFKTANSLLNVLAGIFVDKNSLNDALILNEKNSIIESTHSNVFFVNDNILSTPALETGCVAGVMREKILQLAGLLNLKTEEKIFFNEKNLLEADEVFFTNAIEGIRWVMAYKQRRYYNKIASLLNEKLNKEAFK
jgi:branched-subunit amino acid aminotransferase/4-amino-4-deoxychorismate lyase